MNRSLGILLQTFHFPIHNLYKYPNSTVSTPHNPPKKAEEKNINKPRHYLYKSFVPCHGRAKQEKKKKTAKRSKPRHVKNSTGKSMTMVGTTN